MQTKSLFVQRAAVLAALVLGPVVVPQLAAQPRPLITEFMAINNTSLKDEEGSYPDWIEIYNPSPNPVNLEGWFLTDRSGNLTKWRFPATNLNAFSYLIVYASSKDRAVAGAPLHANFSLDGGGEYLALVDNQTNVVYAFAPAYPDQLGNNSYGPGMLATPAVSLVPVGATARFLVPTADMGSSWTARLFDDTAWGSGPTGLGFDGGTNYTSAIATNLAAQMQGVNATLYTRLPFEVADPSIFQELKLRLRYDDGFIAYLNGTEIVRANAPPNAAWNSTAPFLHGSETGAAGQTVANFDGATSPYTIAANANAGYTTVPSTVQPANAGSTGQFLRLMADGALYIGNSVAFDRAAPGTYPLITADFDFRITDVDGNPADGFAFMLIPTATYGTSGAGAFRAWGGIEEPNIAGVFALGFDMYPHATANDVSVHWNGQELQNIPIPRATLDMVSNQFHRCSMKLEFAPDGSGAYVTVSITANVNGTPGATVVPIDRWFIAGLAPYECRAEFAGRTGGAHMAVDLDNLAVNFVHPSGLVAAEEFDVSQFLGLLQPGTNVLAIQGLNVAATNADFLLEPLLTARSITVQSTQAVYFSTPTPGALNSSGAAEVAADAQFSFPGGIYTNNFALELSSPLPGAVIHYTLNGIPVTELSPTYTNSISVTGSVIVSTRVFAPGYLPSPQFSQYYTVLEPAVASFSSGLPVVILDTLGQRLLRDMDPKATGIFTVIGTAPTTGRATMLRKPDYHGRAGLEGRGQSSWDSFPKKPFNVEIRGEDDTDREASFLDFPPGADFALVNLYTDKTFLNDFLAYELYEKMGHYSMRRRFVEVFYNGTMEGQAADASAKVGLNDRVGIYLLIEKVRIDDDRVNIAKPQTGATNDPITGGFIWKKDKDSPSDVNLTTSSGQFLKYHDPRGEQLTKVQRDWLLAYLNEFESVFYGSNWRDPANGYAKYIDVDSWVDQHWIVEYTKQIDGYRLSNYMQKDRDGKIKMAPIWDWNLSFGNANYLEGGRTNGWYWPLISSTEHIWLRQLVGTPGDADFKQKIIDRWPELSRGDGPFNLTNLLARIDQLSASLIEASTFDFTRWPRLGTYIWPNPNGATGGWHVDYQTPNSYAAILIQMKNWLIGRHNWIDSQYLKAPALSRYAGVASAPLTMSVAPTNAVIFYTLDGSDPRLPGGAVSPKALAYGGTFTPPADARIMARTWFTNTWSPPAKATLTNSAPRLAFTEIMYHPAPGGAFEAEEYEYLELMNTTTNTIDLGGLRVAAGVDFTFPLGPLQPTGSDTTNNFEVSGTAYTAAKLGSDPAASVVAGGPAGSFLRLLTQNSGTNRNRIAFNQTATGPYDQLAAEFDFRGQNLSATQAVGAPTVQTFDAAGSSYVVFNNDTNSATPGILTADAGSSGSYARLTAKVASENGGVYFDATADRAYNVVKINFDFRCDGAADGFGMIFLNTANHGVSGGTPGFSEDANAAASIGAGFDIYLNTQSATEPNANHVSLHFNSAQVGVASPTLSLTANRFHRAQMTIVFTNSQALVTLKISPDINGAGGATETLYNNFVINGVAPYRGRVAFCGRTGGANANQDIDNVNVQYMDSLPVAAGGLSLVLLPAATFGAAGTGSGLAQYSDVPSASNLFALNLDLHAENSINDANVYWNGAQVGNFTIPSAALNLDSGVFHRARLELARTTEGSLATLTITPDVLGAGGAPVVVYSNLLVAGYYPGDTRVEFAGRSGGQNLNLDVDNVAIRYAANAVNPLAPGARILLVKNAAAFAARYGTNLTVTGQYTGQLDNGGERLVIYGRYGEPILDFSYQDAWQPLSDGYGFALVSNDPNTPQNLWDETASWRLGNAVGGTPGQADATPPTFAPAVVNEVLSHVAAPAIEGIELHNPATNAADISHWYLTDNFNQPYKYRFPTNTVIPAGGYLVVTEAQYNAPGAPNGFGLRGEGEEVYLFSANLNGELTGYYHGFDFGPSDVNVSFGRHLTSIGDDHFVAQAAMTFGTNNAGPLVGPVVITEVMYHPPDYAGGVDNPDYEFIELQNITGEPVWLFDPLNPQNTWRLRDAVDFQFPAGTVLPPGGRVLVVSFDPAADPAMLLAFRAKYGLGSGLGIFGPYDGKLDNSTDRVELAKPGQIDATTGQPDFILVDKVKYSDDPAWPQAADGSGYSLQRLDPAQYGNDPANWIAAPPAALAGLGPVAAPVVTGQPASQTVYAHSNVSLSVAATGGGPLAYQWRFNGNNLAGATNAELVLPNIQVAQAGGYQATVLGPNGAADSQTAWVQVFQAPTFLVQPKGGVLLTNSSTNLTVSATGNGPVSYQWRLDGVDILGATSATLSLTNVQYSQSGNYTVAASDGVGSVVSQPATIIVARVPTVSLPGVVATVGTTATLTATVNGSEPMAYRWRLGTTELVPFGKGTNSLVITNVQLPQGGIYQIAVSNALRTNGVTASGFFVVVQPPADRVAATGGSVALQAAVYPTNYARIQWQFGGSNLVGQTAPTLLLTNLGAGQAGAYTFLVTNIFTASAWQSYTCNLALVDNPVAPAITLQPTNLVGAPGAAVQFDALASGTEMLAYQWWFNETNRLAAGTNASLVLTNLTATNAGSYQLIVTNPAGAATSDVATLTMLQPPAITAQPLGTQTVAGVGITLAVEATGAEPLRYQWWYGRYAALVNATNATLSPADSGDYQVVVSNPYGAVTSSVATLSVLQPPMVIVQPQAQSLAAGGSADLSVVAYGDAPITYQWWFNQTNLLAGQNSSVLRLRNLQAQAAGAYTVVLTNPSGAATSIIAMVTISAPSNDTDGDGLPDDWEQAHGLTVGANDAALDLDGDGLSNLQEYLAGTLPNSAASVFKVDAITGGGAATLQFLAVSNRAYAVEFRGLVGAGTWGTLTNLAAQPTNRTVIVTDPNPALTNRFYRIVLPGN